MGQSPGMPIERRIMILGTGESGKTTLSKCFKIMSGVKVLEERSNIKAVLNYNICYCIHAILSFEGLTDFKECATSYETITNFSKLFSNSVSLQQAYKQRHLYHHPLEAFTNLLNRIDDINKLKISLQDFLSSYVKTCGIIRSANLNINNIIFHIYDTGGQRCERKKWKLEYGNTDAFLYLISLSEFNQIMYEANENRMLDSLQHFESIMNDKNFPKSKPFYLIFTKADVLKEKIKEMKFDLTNTLSHIPKYFKVFKQNQSNQFENTDNSKLEQITKLSEDEFCEIISFLSIKDLYSIMLSCKYMYQLINLDRVWYSLCKTQHRDITSEHVNACIDKYSSSTDYNESRFKYYYKNQGYVFEKTLDYIKDMYISKISKETNLKGVKVICTVDLENTTKTISSILEQLK
ncbi:hypothetical protein ABK040_000147 [Willaertia magna]